MAVSTKDQFLDRQITALTEADCIRIFADKRSALRTLTDYSPMSPFAAWKASSASPGVS